MSDAAVAKLLSESQARLKTLEAKVQHLQEMHKVKLEAEIAVRRALVKAESDKFLICERDLSEQKSKYIRALRRPWYENPYLNLVAGVTVGAAGTIAVTTW